MDLVPLTIGKAINMMIESMFEEKLEDLYGLFGHQQDCQMFVYQFVLNLLCGTKRLELTMVSVDTLVQ